MFDNGVRASHSVNPQHADDLYSDDINFHHFTKFKVSPVVHEKRGIVGFSKIRQRHASHEGTWWQQQLNEKTTKSRTAVVIQATALSEAPGGGGADWHSPPSPQLVPAPAGKS